MKKTAPQKIVLIIAFVFSFFIFKSPEIFAQSALGLTAIPPRLEITGNPGETITQEIKVRNDSKYDQIISSQIRDFIVINDSGTPQQIDTQDESKNRWAAASWIQLQSTSITLKPGETKSLMVTVFIPEDGLPGGHYAMILHTPQNNTVLSETGSIIETNVGTLVYVTVPGDIKQDAYIKNFSAPSFSEYGPITFKSTINNLSDIHISPIAHIAIKDIIGQNIANLPLENINIFPYTSRDYSNILNKKILFGRFQALLTAVYGQNGQTTTAALFFWVIPWRLLLIFTLIIIIILMIIKLKKTTLPKKDEKIEELEDEIELLKKKYRDR